MCPKHYTRWRRHGDVARLRPPGCLPGALHHWSRRGVENQSTAKSAVSPSLPDIAWAAGFMEGEGSFTLHDRSTGVRASQVNEEPVRRMFALFGGSLKRYAKKTGEPWIWTWQASGARARGIAMTLYPFLSARRQAQVRHAL